MSKWARVEEVEPTQRGQVYKEGLYLVEIVAVKDVEGQRHDVFFIIETKVLESNNATIAVGAQYSQVINTTNKKAGDAPFADIKAFMCQALNLKADEHMRIGRNSLEYVTSSTQPFAGLKMALQCNERPANPPNQPTPFTYHRWQCVEPAAAAALLKHFESSNLLKK